MGFLTKFWIMPTTLNMLKKPGKMSLCAEEKPREKQTRTFFDFPKTKWNFKQMDRIIWFKVVQRVLDSGQMMRSNTSYFFVCGTPLDNFSNLTENRKNKNLSKNKNEFMSCEKTNSSVVFWHKSKKINFFLFFALCILTNFLAKRKSIFSRPTPAEIV